MAKATKTTRINKEETVTNAAITKLLYLSSEDFSKREEETGKESHTLKLSFLDYASTNERGQPLSPVVVDKFFKDEEYFEYLYVRDCELMEEVYVLAVKSVMGNGDDKRLNTRIEKIVSPALVKELKAAGLLA